MELSLAFLKIFGLQFDFSTNSLLVCIKQCIRGHSFTDVLMKFIDWVSNQIQDFTSNEHKLEILDKEPHQTSLSDLHSDYLDKVICIITTFAAITRCCNWNSN